MSDSKKGTPLLGERIKKNLVAVLIVGFSGAIIYGLPYFRYDYYDAYLEAYSLTNTQMGVFGSIFGVFGMISYLFGGYVADKISIKKLLAFSLFGTGLGGFIHLLPLNFTALLILYAFWGFSSLFAFWPACIKAVRMMADSSDQGKAFGIFEAARGVSAAIVSALAVLAFKLGADRLGDFVGLRWLMVFYAVATCITGVLVLIFMKVDYITASEKMNFSQLTKVLKMPAVWIIAIVTMCNYVFTMSFYYFTPYSTSFLGASVVMGAGIAAARRYVSPISNAGGGFLADKAGTGNLLLVSFLVMALCTGVMISLPLKTNMLVLFIVVYFVNYFFYNVNYSVTWAMMEEGNIPVQFSGTAAGLISTIGYLPEVFCPITAGMLIDGFEGITGYRYYFFFLIGMLLLGAVFVLVWKNYLKRARKASL